MRKILFTLTCFLSIYYNEALCQQMKIQFDTPANPDVTDQPWAWTDDKEWLKALPIGNGSLGVMVYGGVEKERLQLSEESMWSGSPQDSDNPTAFQHLEEIRGLLFAGKYKEATELTNRTQVAKGVGSGLGNGTDTQFGSFQTLGDLFLDVVHTQEGEITGYQRSLDLATGIAEVSYQIGDVTYRREYFCSFPDKVLVAKFSSNKNASFSISASLARPERYTTRLQGTDLIMEGALNDGKGEDGLKYTSRLSVRNKGGDVIHENSKIQITGAQDVMLVFSADTDHLLEYPHYKKEGYEENVNLCIDAALEKGFEDLKKDHIADHSALFDRVTFDLNSEQTNVPTDRLLNAFSKGQKHPNLYELIFQYGRYLLIASSRKNTLPANLQGVWTNKIQSPWNGDYHTDVNLEMNYWPAEVTNLPETHAPLFEFIASLVPPGEKTAKTHYNSNGWVVHPITNIWGYTSPGEEASWGMHTGATAWISQHIMEHFRFNQDTLFLERMYPTLEKACHFYLDWLVRDPESGLYISGPAVSPENTFITASGDHAQISMGPTHDHQVIRSLFQDYLQASNVLGNKTGTYEKVMYSLNNLMGNKIGSDGRLMEWTEEFEEAEPGHRHISHLFALHPGNEISPINTPELADAAEKSIEYRMKHGGGKTGWSATWLISQYARLFNGEKALKNLDVVLSNSTAPNLFGYYPPFQLDANFGVTAGIAEMILQSHTIDAENNPILHLLPALPESWADGKMIGLKARPGVTVNLSWENGNLTLAEFTSLSEIPFKVLYKEKAKTLNPKRGEVIYLRMEDFD